MQERLKEELGTDGYMDYGLMICQANGRPIMTEHLNQRFKDVLAAMKDPDVPTEGIVFHSIRHTQRGPQAEALQRRREGSTGRRRLEYT